MRDEGVVDEERRRTSRYPGGCSVAGGEFPIVVFGISG
jgi:hypothetical protein